GRGREFLRPLGIEADQRGAPVPPDHPFFAMAWRMGLGQPLGVEERPGRRGGARRGVVLAEEMSYWDRGMSVAMPGLGLGGPPLLGMGTPEQKERFLAPFRDRERPHWAAFAMTEPGAGSDVAAIQTTAVRAGDGWVLNGAKTFISNSMRADWIVVWATVDRSAGRAGHRAFVVERGSPGIEASMAKAFAAGMAQEATGLAVEILGDAGVTADAYVEKLYRDVKGMDIVEGTGQIQRIVIARRLVGLPR